ncbi:hypothetical protein M5K25_008974 [Dendrobium thyrsiflorum]|uniref:Uncharacterized protein n=1 Tax=Dendrobium thyrsiflorum TaxID=117978 RepID=A0ABD0VAP1_DENTH
MGLNHCLCRQEYSVYWWLLKYSYRKSLCKMAYKILFQIKYIIRDVTLHLSAISSLALSPHFRYVHRITSKYEDLKERKFNEQMLSNISIFLTYNLSLYKNNSKKKKKTNLLKYFHLKFIQTNFKLTDTSSKNYHDRARISKQNQVGNFGK